MGPAKYMPGAQIRSGKVHILSRQGNPSMRNRIICALVAVAALSAAAAVAATSDSTEGPDSKKARSGESAAEAPDPDQEGGFKFRFVGPKVGNRIAAVAGIPGDPTPITPVPPRVASGSRPTAATAGSRSSTRSTWRRSAPWLSRPPRPARYGLAPARPGPFATATSWATASTSRRMPGAPGRTWVCRSPVASAASSFIPTNPDIVFACVLGRTTGPQQERGVFRTTDGGQHWDARAVRRARRPAAPDFPWMRTILTPCSLACGRWKCTPGANTAAAPAAAIYISHDGGTKWTRLDGARPAASPRWARSTWPLRRPIPVASMPDPDERSGFGMALRRGGQGVETRELPARADRPRGILHPPGGIAEPRQ